MQSNGYNISNDRSFGCPVIYADTIYNAVMFIHTSTMSGTTNNL